MVNFAHPCRRAVLHWWSGNADQTAPAVDLGAISRSTLLSVQQLSQTAQRSRPRSSMHSPSRLSPGLERPRRAGSSAPISRTLPAALPADWLTAVWDQNAAFAMFAPAEAAVETGAARWLLDLFVLHPQHRGRCDWRRDGALYLPGRGQAWGACLVWLGRRGSCVARRTENPASCLFRPARLARRSSCCVRSSRRCTSPAGGPEDAGRRVGLGGEYRCRRMTDARSGNLPRY